MSRVEDVTRAETTAGQQPTTSDASSPPIVRLVDVRVEPLSVDEVLGAVADSHCGGLAMFVGTIRDHDEGRDVATLDYTAHPMATSALTEVAERIAAAHEVHAVAAVHRVGDLQIGDVAVVAAVASPHRAAAFTACRALIDEVKDQVPIWKHQTFVDGTAEWVGTP